MTNIDNFVNSTLKVTASEDLNIEKDLASENTTHQTIDQLLEKSNEQTEQQQKE
jgi:hypothetical protein